MKTSELIDLALDYAVCIAENRDVYVEDDAVVFRDGDFGDYSTDWSLAGPIIERERIATFPTLDLALWNAGTIASSAMHHGPTPLVAAMRCYVASKLGDDIDIPAELMP